MGLVICWRKSCWGPGQLIPGDPPAECHVLAPGWVGVARALSLLTPERCFTKKILMGSGSFIFKGLNSLWLLGLWGLGWLRAWGFYSGTEQEKALTQAGFHQLSKFRVWKVWARELPAWYLDPSATYSFCQPSACGSQPSLYFLCASPHVGGRFVLLV